MLAGKDIVQVDVSRRLKFGIEASEGLNNFGARLGLIGTEGNIQLGASLEGRCPEKQRRHGVEWNEGLSRHGPAPKQPASIAKRWGVAR